MDEYGGTYFDLASSSASYPLGSGTGFLNDLTGFSSSETHAKISGTHNYEQVNDLDSLLLPSAEFQSVGANSFQNVNSSEIVTKTTEVNKQLNGSHHDVMNFSLNKIVKTEVRSGSFGVMDQTHSLDAILDQCTNPTATTIATSGHNCVTVAPVKVENSLNVPRIIRADGSIQTLVAGSKIQVQGLSTGSKMIRLCMPKTNSIVQPLSVKSIPQAPVQCKQEIFNTFPPSKPFNLATQHLEPVVSSALNM